MEINKQEIMKDAPIFGLSWLSDGATISRIPFINTLEMCANVPPTCVAINDCSDHIAFGGKNDTPYIASLTEDTVLTYDPTKRHTVIFFFNGTHNVAKAGKVLEAIFPRAYTLHGGEHVVSLFFDDLSTEKAVQVKVCCHKILLACIIAVTHPFFIS